jgi:carbon-monoxide dehydrogenase medium subunit
MLKSDLTEGGRLKHFREILVAKSPEDAVRLRSEAGTRALYLAGGTMVVPLAVRSVDVLVDVGRLDLGGVALRDGTLSIGAMTRLADLLAPEVAREAPLVWAAASKCATPLIRNAATVGGWLAVAHLPSDLVVALLASGATVEVARETRSTVAIADLLARGWLKGPDLVCAVGVPRSRAGEGVGFQKFGRSAIDIAIVNAAARIVRSANGTVGDIAVAVGQSSSLPVLIAGLADEAGGKQLTRKLVGALAGLAAKAVKPRADFRASAEYRQHLVEVLVARALAEAAEKAGWNLED